jgi:hypothetical protein
MENDKQRNNDRNDRNSEDQNMKNNSQSPTGEDKEQKELNRNWDLAQRRQQASPRSYNENTDSENIENQNTLAEEEQVDEETHNDRNAESDKKGKKVGDKISERQQSIDEKDASKDRRVD